LTEGEKISALACRNRRVFGPTSGSTVVTVVHLDDDVDFFKLAPLYICWYTKLFTVRKSSIAFMHSAISLSEVLGTELFSFEVV